jgi:hypothetical protein
VLAKVKCQGRRNETFYKLISDSTLFKSVKIDTNSWVEYNPDHNLDEDAWFKIEQFSQQAYCIDLLMEEFNSTDLDNITREQFSKITYLCAVQDEDFYFQKITPSLFVRKKFIAFGEIAKIEQNDTRLVINSQPDAVYFKTLDTLIFRNLPSISSIFNGIDQLYKEATNEEVESLLNQPFIELGNNYDKNKVSKPNRKRIALAAFTLAGLSEEDKNKLPSYIKDYCGQTLTFNDEEKKFQISSDNDLKMLLYGIEQRFYTTPFGHEKRLANSVQPIS